MRKFIVVSTLALGVIAAACDQAADTPTAPSRQVSTAGGAHSVSIAAATAWTASGPGVTVVSDGTAGDAVMSYYAPDGFGSWTFTTTATQTGTVTLPWSYSGTAGGLTQVDAVVNNVVVATLATTNDAAFSLNGTFAFNVNPGDTYGFLFTSFSLFGDPISGTFTVQVPQPPQDPATKDDCKNGGWAAFGFSNQGQCIGFVETGNDGR
jgi:hypothetical protein